MRRLAVALLLFAPTIAACSEPKCAACPACPTVAAQVLPAEIATVLDDWHDAAARADEARYFGHFAEGGVFLGTDGKERWTVPELRAYAHPHFAKGKAWTFRAVRREITYSGNTAWFDEDLDTPHLGPARGSGVLVRDAAGTWRIAQYNLSIPIPNERFAEVKAIIERPDR